MQTHKDLKVWQESIQFVTLLYQITNDFPKTEIYGLTSQIRRAAVSVPSNIAEGSARKGKKERIYFYYIALASNSEIETQLIIAKNLNFMSQQDFEQLEIQNNQIGRQLVKLIRHFENKSVDQ